MDQQRLWLALALLALSGVAASISPSSSQHHGDDNWIIVSQRSCVADSNGECFDKSSWSETLLRRLDLTPEDASAVRLNVPTEPTNELINRTLSWLEERLDLSTEGLRDIVVGYPGVLELSLETNLKPTVAFFADALRDSKNDDSDRLIAEFICQSPRLLEYNVKKRLVPRFDRVKELLNVDAVNAITLRAIATSTDSRFEEWLQKEMELIGHESPAHIVESTLPDDNQQGPLAFVVMSNLQSGGNIGNIVRSASIFGVTECVVVGQKRYRLTGDHGARFDLPRRHMWSHSEARDYLKKTIGGVRIYGIEIMPDAAPIMQYDQETGVMRFPFDRQWSGAAFIFGNEGAGLSVKQKEICDEFIFIPQTRGGTRDGGGSASMNVACAATVILQAYSTWAGYSDAPCEGEKFVAVPGTDIKGSLLSK